MRIWNMHKREALAIVFAITMEWCAGNSLTRKGLSEKNQTEHSFELFDKSLIEFSSNQEDNTVLYQRPRSTHNRRGHNGRKSFGSDRGIFGGGGIVSEGDGQTKVGGRGTASIEEDDYYDSTENNNNQRDEQTSNENKSQRKSNEQKSQHSQESENGDKKGKIHRSIETKTTREKETHSKSRTLNQSGGNSQNNSNQGNEDNNDNMSKTSDEDGSKQKISSSKDECMDRLVFCGAYERYCRLSLYESCMKFHCPKTCNKCGSTDKSADKTNKSNEKVSEENITNKTAENESHETQNSREDETQGNGNGQNEGNKSNSSNQEQSRNNSGDKDSGQGNGEQGDDDYGDDNYGEPARR